MRMLLERERVVLLTEEERGRMWLRHGVGGSKKRREENRDNWFMIERKPFTYSESVPKTNK